jgi:3-oxoacyl-[acyl-carrier protein] reductase
MKMSSRNVFLTGGSRGIGRAVKEKFIASGYTVYAPTREELDLSNGQSLKKYIEMYKAITFDIIINNAGINEINLLENIDECDMENMFQIDLIAPILLLKGFIPNMKKNKRGWIVNIGSVWAVVSKEGRGLYSSVKNGLHGITNALALELAPYNILVNTVCPGFTLTELTKKNNTDVEIKKINELIPLKRMANPAEIAEFVFFLCSENNTYITGQKICIDGGYTVR